MKEAQEIIAKHKENLERLKAGRRNELTLLRSPYESDDQLIEYLERRILYWTTYILSEG